MRFSHDKRPYKEHAACHFRHISGKDAHAPGFYVHLEPGSVFFGGGVWRPDNPTLRQVRDAIVDDPAGWKKATRAKAFLKRFEGVTGDGLKRVPAGYDPDHPFAEDLKRKSFFAVQRVNQSVATTPEFAKEVQRAFVALGPMMEFLTAAVGVPYSLDD